jgi:hypothetical protein
MDRTPARTAYRALQKERGTPYFTNIKILSIEMAFAIVKDWLFKSGIGPKPPD